MEYREIFNHRGDAYHEAMKLCPLAREEEFRIPLRLLNLRSGEVLCDFPSGGGYLSAHLDEGIEVVALEASEEFAARGHDCSLASWSSLPLTDGSMDGALSLAALHHASEREAFYSEVHRVLRPAGKFVIGDVAAGSLQAEFLNGFVNEYNSMGHVGKFLEDGVESRRLARLGFEVESEEICHYQWAFESREVMILFCRGLFGLDLASDEEIFEGLGPLRDEDCRINWALLFLKARRS